MNAQGGFFKTRSLKCIGTLCIITTLQVYLMRGGRPEVYVEYPYRHHHRERDEDHSEEEIFSWKMESGVAVTPPRISMSTVPDKGCFRV